VTDFLNDLGNTLAWVGTAVALMAAGFRMVDVLTPGRLSAQVSQNLNAGLLVGAKLLAVGIIVFSAIWTAPDALGDGLLQAGLYSALGLGVSAVVFLVIDLALPVRLRHLVDEDRFDPAICAAVGAEIGLALVVAAAIS
jgi:uncharacterized membrane protein YjfL (UPF0719 family)